MAQSSITYSSTVLTHWDTFLERVKGRADAIAIDGHGLDIASVIAVSRHHVAPHLHERTLISLNKSSIALKNRLEAGGIIYGVNTGFGGSADTRTRQVEELQRTLIRELHSGILHTPSVQHKPEHAVNGGHNEAASSMAEKRKRDPSPQPNGSNMKRHMSQRDSSASNYDEQSQPWDDVVSLLEDASPVDDLASCMPEVWTRASILIRINSLASGYSGVRPILVTTMAELLKHNIIPRVPLRGSISASGDLMPLSYIAGTLLGKPTLSVVATNKDTGGRFITTAQRALIESSVKPIKLGPKEGLAIVNGTAVSTGVAALAVHEAHGLATLSQVLTAMSVEALCGNSESFDPFFAKVRPHEGQIEASHNVYSFLQGSQLIQNPDGSEEGSLRQDRYSIRTASQWLGPVLEDLLLAHRQVSIECNSVTDNPLIDGSRMLHGGNFQARAITSAMEKVRLGLQSIGRMMFTQCTELLNPKTNRGLPPNLVADEPSASWVMKPLDIMIAALLSELGFLANPVGTHVQTAEMGNQALNSLALISARYCHMALDVLSQLAAGHLFAVCQALDLRAMQARFLEALKPELELATEQVLEPVLATKQEIGKLHVALWAQIDKSLEQAMSLDTEQRFTRVVSTLQPIVIRYLETSATESIPALKAWTERCSESMLHTFEITRDHYSAHPDAKPLLGSASYRMYSFVRGYLAVPFLRAYRLRSQGSEAADGSFSEENSPNEDNATTGTYITRIYDAIRNGSLYVPVMACLREVHESRSSPTCAMKHGSKVSGPEKVLDNLVSESTICG